MDYIPVDKFHTRSMYSLYCTNQMHIISYIWVLNMSLRHVSVQVYQLNGAQYASFLAYIDVEI
jgi:hypothetical protein